MKKTAVVIMTVAAAFCLGLYFNPRLAVQPAASMGQRPDQDTTKTKKQNTMKLGAFSVSLSVKDLAASKQFYENLGFTAFAGGMQQNYLIMKNGNALIGLFQGMFQGNILTFNPGWDENAKNVDPFDDVRDIQRQLKIKNIALTAEADEKTTGPASLMTTDPDGNIILFDQHR